MTLPLLLALVFSGCVAREVRWHATSLRENALAYYEDQIMDNLIRARNGQLFVHVNLGTINAIVRDGFGANFGGGRTLFDNTTSAVTSKPFSFLLNPSRGSEVQLSASTLIEEEDAYASYIRFLNLRSSQQRLKDAERERIRYDEIVSLVVKDEGVALSDVDCIPGTLKRGNDGRYYYIPTRFKAAYQELCLGVLQSLPKSPAETAANEAKSAGRNVPTVDDLKKELRREAEKTRNELRLQLNR